MKQTNELNEKYNISFIRLRFTIGLSDGGVLPRYKSSALRGGIGEMLLRANCISDRDCERCRFESECIVRRTLYSGFDSVKPEFIPLGGTESVGYIISCEDYKTDFDEGDQISFYLILFGKNMVYFNQYLQAITSLGYYGLGKNKIRFRIIAINNSRNEMILDGNNIIMSNYKVSTIKNYIKYRRKMIDSRGFHDIVMYLRSPLSINYHGAVLNDFQIRPFVEAAERRVHILNCYENQSVPMKRYTDDELPQVERAEIHHVVVPRFSNHQDMKMYFNGINGEIVLRNVSDALLNLMFASELLNVGKNTSFGFGRVMMSLPDNKEYQS